MNTYNVRYARTGNADALTAIITLTVRADSPEQAVDEARRYLPNYVMNSHLWTLTTARPQ